MILVTRNHASEFASGCDYTVVRLDAALVEAIAARARQCRRMREQDGSLAEIRHWDASPQCIGSLDHETAASIDEALDEGDGWAVMGDDALGAFEAAHADCTQMAIMDYDSTSIEW